MAGRKFSMMDYFNSRCAQMQPLFGFEATDEAGAKLWRVKALAKLRDLLGELPEPIPLSAETIEVVDMGSYVREKVVFDADPHSSIPGYILIPKALKGPGPAILCLHGHGPGKDPVVGITEPRTGYTREAMESCIQQHNYDYARQFVERGYVTFTFDFRCFGERAHTSFDLFGRDPCNVHFIRGSLLGINLLSMAIADTFRAVDYMLTRPEIDHARIGCLGLSFGGTMTMWAAALDKRIRAACISCYLSEFEAFAVQNGNFCGSQFIPALRRYFEVSDIASLIAPRPLLIENGIYDDGFPIEASRRAYERLQEAYAAWGVPDHLAQDLFEGGHQFSGARAFDFFAARL